MMGSILKTWQVVLALLLLAGLSAAPRVTGQASPYRGLWVGTATLDAVSEVSIPLDADNVPRASDPRIPTATFDAAQLRILIHVNGAGQASLLKDVAILNRVDSSTAQSVAEAGQAREADLVLVTDPRLYAEFPPQPAMRTASAAFDFGDAKATEVLDVMVEEAAQIATAFAMAPALTLATQAQRLQARADIEGEIQPVLDAIAGDADVAASFGTFVGDFPAQADAIAAGSADVAALLATAEGLRDASFYGDTRAVEMVHAVVQAVDDAAPGAGLAAARNTAAAYADVLNTYQRFISGQVFGDMVTAAAQEAAVVAAGPGVTQAQIETALRTTPQSAAAITRALQIKLQAFEDRRGEDAIDAVLAAMAQTAFENSGQPASEIRRRSEATGRAVLSDIVARFPLPVTAPTLDYTAFVRSALFAAVPATAAQASARAAVDERAVNPLYTEWSIYTAAFLGALDALRQAYGQAARALRTELPLAGALAPGAGDARRLGELAQPTDLGPPGLEGRIVLPASHPTNPFRHRRHPDHTQGIPIERLIRFDFDGVAGDSLQRAGYGVDRISGIYREEIFGLHKPLGPDPATAPVGLRTEGRFELNRISLIDTLNTR